MVEDPHLKKHLDEIRRQSLILKDERRFIKAAREGDMNAKQELIESYLYITALIGLRLARPTMKPLDAIQEANIVLLRLIDKGVEKPVVELGPAIEKHFAALEKRALFNVLVLPFRFLNHGIEYAVFKRSGTDEDFWQGITGGGEGAETPLETARRETWEESNIPKDSEFIQLDSVFSTPVYFFGDSHLWRKDKYVIPVYCFGVQAGGQEIILSDEHTDFQWLAFEDATEILKFENNKYALWELDQRLKDLRI